MKVSTPKANIFEVYEYNQTGVHQDYSVGWIYGNRDPEKYTGDNYNPGMITRLAMAKACKDGDIYRDTWEYMYEMPECYTKRLAIVDQTKDLASKFSAYVRLYTYDEVKRFIYKYNLPVLITAESINFSIFEDESGHAVACYGWNADGYLLYTNSWGTGGAYGTGKGKIEFEKLKEAWGLVPMVKTFKDVTEDQWFYSSVMEAAQDGMMLDMRMGHLNLTII